MNREKLQTAIQEAERFLDRARTAQNGFVWTDFTNRPGGYFHHEHTPDTAAAKRASMDLTRALADLRRGEG